MSALVFNDKVGLTYFALATAKGAVNLESKGMKNSGGSVRVRMARQMGYKTTVKHDEIVAEIQRRMDALVALRTEFTFKNAAIANGFSIHSEMGMWYYGGMGLIKVGQMAFSKQGYATEDEAWKAACDDCDLYENNLKPEGTPA